MTAEKTTNHIKTSEFATPERSRQDGGVTVEPVDRSLKGDVIQVRHKAKVADKMDWYLSKGTIEEGMSEAGKRLMQIFFAAGKVPRTSIMFREFTDRTRMPGDYETTINCYTDAQIRLNEALDLLSQEEIDVLREVCCYDRFAGERRRVNAMVRGLAVLAEHWGF